MQISLSWAGVGVMLAIIIHGAASIWWASRITSEISNLNKSMNRLDTELEKRDSQIKAAWNKIDNINIRMATVEAKCKILSHNEN